MFYATLFITSRIRGADKATATMEQYLYSIKVLYRTCERLTIDLVERIASRKFLTNEELDAIRDDCKRGGKVSRQGNVIRLKNGYNSKEPSVSPATQHMYLTRIAGFLKWLCEHLLAAKRFNHATAEQIGALQSALLERRPLLSAENVDDAERKGITKAQESKLFQVLLPGSSENPFADAGVQIRNYLIVKLMRALGPRRGEVLNVQIGDLDFKQNILKIVRRADTNADRRRRQPRVKTKARVLILSSVIMDELRSYIVDVRKRIPNSSRHRYLFVTHKSGPSQGQPLSISGQQEIFKQIGRVHADLQLHAHMLRHTWNERYSEAMEGNTKHSHAEVEQWRNLMQGWTPTSTMGLRYNAVHVQRKAHEASLATQSALEANITAARSRPAKAK